MQLGKFPLILTVLSRDESAHDDNPQGMRVPTMIIPKQDCKKKGEHPNIQLDKLHGVRRT